MRLFQRVAAFVELQPDTNAINHGCHAERRQGRHWCVLVNAMLVVAQRGKQQASWAIEQKASRLGLKKSKTYMKKLRSGKK
jgi:hypothetical protein